jgi:hypothetical protein
VITGVSAAIVWGEKVNVATGPVIPAVDVIELSKIVGVIVPAPRQSILNEITSLAFAEVRSGSDEQLRDGSGTVTRFLGMLLRSTFVLNWT